MNTENMNMKPDTKRKLSVSWEDMKESKYLKTEPGVSDNEQDIGSTRRYSSATSVMEAVEEGLFESVRLGQQEHFECILCQMSMSGIIPAQAHLNGYWLASQESSEKPPTSQTGDSINFKDITPQQSYGIG